ncbi:MAG: hypothetical protein ABSG64_13700, partial [Solirubrobacteraceae bacterium]
MRLRLEPCLSSQSDYAASVIIPVVEADTEAVRLRSVSVALPALPPDSALSALSREEIERLCFFNLIANPEERFFFKDRESRFVLVSTGWLEAVAKGLTLDEVIGKTDFDITEREQAEVAFADEQRVIATGQP